MHACAHWIVGCFTTSHTATQLAVWGRRLLGQREPSGLQFLHTVMSVERYVPSPKAAVCRRKAKYGLVNSVANIYTYMQSSVHPLQIC